MSIQVVWNSLAKLIDYSFSELETYVGTVQGALKREKEHFDAWLEKQLAGLDDEAADEQAELYTEDFTQLAENLPGDRPAVGFPGDLFDLRALSARAVQAGAEDREAGF